VERKIHQKTIADFHIVKEKKRGSSALWNGVERLFACLKYTRMRGHLTPNPLINAKTLKLEFVLQLTLLIS
jgi:hypothetical protein